MNARSFYGSRNPQNPTELSSNESEEDSEDTSCEDSDSYCPFELSFSNLFISDFDETSPEYSDDDDQGSSIFNGLLLMVVTRNSSCLRMTVASTDLLECQQRQWNLSTYIQ